ncbi:MAG: acetyltransferase-like isoleucine patch superfamily enzyme [Nitriliruptoraceae bacterium]|jgi:acetyltransferase-like isoleucine patch superfamily enzyme
MDDAGSGLSEDAVRAGHAALVDAAVRSETAAEGQRRLSMLTDDLAAEAGVSVERRRPPMRPTYPRWGWRGAVRYAVERKMTTPEYLKMYRRWLFYRGRIAATGHHVQLQGMAFLGKRVELTARPGHGRLVIGPWAHIGDDNKLRAHEGQLTVGAKVVFGRDNVINTYLDIEVGDASILADWIYICDFDHRIDRLDIPIKDQGIVKSPTRIGADVWVGEKATILRGVDIGYGAVIASHCLVNKDVAPFAIAVGVPVRVVRSRLPAGMTPEEGHDLVLRGLPIPGDPLGA